MYGTRNTSIDIAKGFAILLMIIGHCAGIPYLLRNFIFSFHMPLFFIFSGYFFKLKNIRDVINNGNKHLVCPYIITAIIAIFLCLTAQDYKYGCEKFVGALMSNGGWPNELIGANLPYIGPIWFLLALYWCKIFYSILCQKLKNLKVQIIISFIISTTSLIIGKYIINIPFGILTGLCGLVFYAMGDYWKNQIKMPLSKFYLLTGISLWAMCVVYSHLELASFDCKHYPISMLAAFCGTYITYLISTQIKGKYKSIMCWLGRNTMLILCYHTLFDFVYLNFETYVFKPNNITISYLINRVLMITFSLGGPMIHYKFNQLFKRNKTSHI